MLSMSTYKTGNRNQYAKPMLETNTENQYCEPKLGANTVNQYWNPILESNTENQIHKFKTGLGNNFTRKITQFDLQMNKIKDFESIVEASKELKIGKSNIQGVLLNSRKTAGGIIFKYLE